jgi:hypothetical protein
MLMSAPDAIACAAIEMSTPDAIVWAGIEMSRRGVRVGRRPDARRALEATAPEATDTSAPDAWVWDADATE